jgi:PAS domain S-box-containing protein
VRTTERLLEQVQPLERKLPLLIAALLCAVVAAFGWLANRELSLALETAAGDRLGIAAQRLSTMLTESLSGSRAMARRIASDSAIVAAVERPDDSIAHARAVALLSGPTVGQPSTRAIWTAACERVVVVGPSSSSDLVAACPYAAESPSGAAQARHDHVGPLVAHGDTVFTAVFAPVVRADGDTIGYFEEVRGTRGGQEGRMLTSLIGRDVSLAVGNAQGADVWTDLSHRVDGPPQGTERGTLVRYTRPGGEPQLGYAIELKGAPWVVWVQMPVATALAAQYTTNWKLALLALICIVLGVLGAWVVGNHVTGPLVELTTAADDLASGNYSRRVSVERRDELGHLTSSFNRMAAQVELSNTELTGALADARLANERRELVQSVLDEVLAQAPVGIAVFDTALCFVRLNHAQARMHGIPIEAHEGRTLEEVSPVLATIDVAQLRHVLATGETVSNLPCNALTADGVRRHWLATYFPIRGVKGELVGAGAIVLDATAHHELEAQLLQAQKMDAVGRLAGGVAHDFNNLLTVISSYTELAIESLSPGDPLRTDMKEIRSAADRASRLTRQLLAFSRKQVMQPQVLDLNQVARDMERMLHRLIGEDVVLTLVSSADLGEVRADPGQIEQVIMNLALNARDAMHSGGSVVIRTADATVPADDHGALAPGEYVTVSVSDTGTGIDEETKSHLFEPFFTTKSTGHGTGLGLSTAYGIVKQSGGDIIVQSEVGAGSTFTMYLPRIPRSGAVTSRLTPISNGAFGGSETILLVEDDAALRTMAKRVLVAAGYTVLEARSPTDAIDLSERHQGLLDLLLTDVVMPAMNGRAMAERIGESRPGLRVLFMSGYTDDDVVRRGVVTATAEFLQKPFTPEQLMRRVREVFDGTHAS